MAGYIADHIDQLTQTAIDITKTWLKEHRPDITEVTSQFVQIGLFEQFERTGRLVALDVAARHPEFQPVVQTVQKNTPILLSTEGDEFSKTLSAEMDQVISFYLESDWNDEPEYVSLLLAYVSWAFKYEKENFDEKMQEFFASINKHETLPDGVIVNLLMAMWFWGYEGFPDRVMAACAQPAAKSGEFIAKHIDAMAGTVCEIAKAAGGDVTRESVHMAMFRHFLEKGRVSISKEIAARHPEFLPVAQTIESDTKEMVNLPGEQFGGVLEKEMNMLMEVYSAASWYNEPDFVALLLAYACWGFKDRKAEMENSVQQLFASLDQHEEIFGTAREDLMVALWFWDYDGFQDRVLACAGKSASSAAPAQDGYIAQNMGALVDAAINLAKEEGTDFTQQSIEDCLSLSWLGKRYGVAQAIAAKHPVFNAFVQQIETDDLVITNPASSSDAILGTLQQEAFQLVKYKEQSELAQDVDFMSLHLAFSCWMLKQEKDEYEEQVQPLFAVLDRQSELSAASMLDLIASLWFWNYDNFQGRVMQRINDLINQVQAKKQEYRKRGVCQYCGGAFKGMLSKKCSVCGRPKDY